MSADVLALFDLDHTLLTLDSDEAWVEFLIEEGILDRAEFERANHQLVERYRAGEATSVEFTHFYMSTLVGREPALLDAWHAKYLVRKIQPAISAAARDLLAIARCLAATGESFAMARRHDRQCFGCRQHGSMAAAGMVGMAMGDDGMRHRPHRIDVESAELATHAGRGRHQDVFRAHGT